VTQATAGLAQAFHNACRALLPKAKPVVDRFHVARLFKNPRIRWGLPNITEEPKKQVRTNEPTAETGLSHDSSLRRLDRMLRAEFNY
jgi:hypothetical protein